MASFALNGLGMFLDPVNWVVGKVVGWAIDLILAHVPPCKKAMDFLTGSEDAVHSWAESFQRASKDAAACATDLASRVDAMVGTWEGPAADAHREALRAGVELQRSIAERQHTIYTMTYGLGSLVAAVKEIVVGLIKELISDLITKALLAAAAAVPSLGSAIAAYMAWAAGKYALVMGKVARWFQKLFSKAASKTANFQQLSRLFEKAAEGFGRLAGKFDEMGEVLLGPHLPILHALLVRLGVVGALRRRCSRDEAGAGASTPTKVVVSEGGKGLDDSTERHPYDSTNPADAIPYV